MSTTPPDPGQLRGMDVAPPHSNKEFTPIPLPALGAAALRRSRWDHRAVAREGIGRACRKVQPFMFKTGFVTA